MPVKAVAPQDPEPEKEPGGLDALTAGETAMAERTAAQSITTLGNENFPQSTLIGALGWVFYRRKDSRMKFDDYMNSRKLSDITKELGLGEDEDEEEGKDDAASTLSS